MKTLTTLTITVPPELRRWINESLACRLFGSEREAALYYIRKGLMEDNAADLRRKYEEALRLLRKAAR